MIIQQWNCGKGYADIKWKNSNITNFLLLPHLWPWSSYEVSSQVHLHTQNLCFLASHLLFDLRSKGRVLDAWNINLFCKQTIPSLGHKITWPWSRERGEAFNRRFFSSYRWAGSSKMVYLPFQQRLKSSSTRTEKTVNQGGE